MIVGTLLGTNQSEPPKSCEPGLIAEDTRFMVATFYEDRGSTREYVPVEIREKTGNRGIEVYTLNRKPKMKYEAARVSNGPHIYIARTALLKANGNDWEWTVNARPNHWGQAAWGLWTHYHQAVEKLMSHHRVALEEVMRSELHAFWWNERAAYLLRLPVRDPNVAERFRPMWLFANDAMDPIPIGRAVDGLRLNGEAFMVNQNRVYRFEDGEGVLRYVFEPKGSAR